MITTSLCTAVICTALFVRIITGYQPHSGQDNHHGSKAAYGGDYEAQRHWMELTWHLPIGDWYYHDLQYWGLDYPPLTAYVSYVCGHFSELLVGPHTVALGDSRGYENDPTHKAYMRATVWILELGIYFPAAYYVLRALWRNEQVKQQQARIGAFDYRFAAVFLLALLQPSIILIDHGHFQYNTVALGLVLWSLYFMTQQKFYWGCIWGSVCFSLALNFKQMTLYYAPVIFAYLLGRCFAGSGTNKSNNIPSTPVKEFLQRFVALGLTVIVTFAILWFPFLVNGPSDEQEESQTAGTLSLVLSRGTHVLHRIFPLERGLFEGKVSNLWCALDTKPINIRQRIPAQAQPIAALVVTLLLMMPSCIKLFLVGKRTQEGNDSDGQSAGRNHQKQNQRQASDLKVALWGATSSALSFFLASFQVHEKSILLALCTASMLGWDDALFCDWFGIVAAWTMWPLLVTDRLQVAYICLVSIFIVGVWTLRAPSVKEERDGPASTLDKGWRALAKVSFVAMVGLHILELIVPVPPQLPDLFPVLWSVGGCALCCLAWLRTVIQLLLSSQSQLEGDPKSKAE